MLSPDETASQHTRRNHVNECLAWRVAPSDTRSVRCDCSHHGATSRAARVPGRGRKRLFPLGSRGRRTRCSVSCARYAMFVTHGHHEVLSGAPGWREREPFVFPVPCVFTRWLCLPLAALHCISRAGWARDARRGATRKTFFGPRFAGSRAGKRCGACRAPLADLDIKSKRCRCLVAVQRLLAVIFLGSAPVYCAHRVHQSRVLTRKSCSVHQSIPPHGCATAGAW